MFYKETQLFPSFIPLKALPLTRVILGYFNTRQSLYYKIKPQTSADVEYLKIHKKRKRPSEVYFEKAANDYIQSLIENQIGVSKTIKLNIKRNIHFDNQEILRNTFFFLCIEKKVPFNIIARQLGFNNLQVFYKEHKKYIPKECDIDLLEDIIYIARICKTPILTFLFKFLVIYIFNSYY